MLHRGISLATALVLLALVGNESVVARPVPFPQGHLIDGSFDSPTAIAFGDLDRDGDLDAVGAGSGADEIRWWENDGSPANGGWTARAIATGFDGAFSLALADLDRDGGLDVVATAHEGDAVAWWHNDGTPADGGWTAHVLSTSFDGAFDVAVADLDGDGDGDVLATAFMANDLAWWENDGSPLDGGWTLRTLESDFCCATAAAAADLDGDGDLDVLAASEAGDVSWWENGGGPSGALITWTRHAIDETYLSPRDVAAVDLDRDGDLDVIGAAWDMGQFGNADLAWWENDGNPDTGLWTRREVSRFLAGAERLAIGDLDTDGDLDILAAAFVSNEVSWWENSGNPASVPLSWPGRFIDRTTAGPHGATLADIDGDGDLDAAVAASAGDRILWYQNRTIHRSAAFDQTRSIGAMEGVDVDAADLDRDGDLDAIATGIDGVTWWPNDGTPADGPWTALPITGPQPGALAMASGDLDRDGDVDIVVADTFLDTVTWWENDGTPLDGGWTLHPLAASIEEASGVALGDLDRDGDLDVVATAGAADDVLWWQNDGTPADGGWLAFPIALDFDGAYGVAIADLDGDGDLDVLAAGFNADAVTWWENDGAPADPPSPPVWTAHTIDPAFDGATDVTTADMNGDGRPDVLASAIAAGDIAWWENDGTPADGGWARRTVEANLAGAVSAQAVDLDGDGDFDVVAAGISAWAVGWWENALGDGLSWIPRPMAFGLEFPYAVAIADFDRDGRLDVLGGGDSGVAWWRNHGGQLALSTSAVGPLTAFDASAVAMLRIQAIHRGRFGDSDAELASLSLMFESAPGSPLTTVEANAVVERLRIYRDGGSGAFDAADTLVTTVETLSLDARGVQTVAFTDGDAGVRIAAGLPRTYFVVPVLAGDASVKTPSTFRITHLAESIAEDAAHDIPLVLEPTADATATVTAVSNPDLIFQDGFENGTVAAWSANNGGGGDLSVSSAAALAATTQGMAALVNDVTPLYVQDTTPNDLRRYRARFYLDTNGFDPGEAQGHRRTRTLILFSEPTRRVAAVVLRRLNGAYAILGRARQDDNSQADTGFFPIADGAHWIELELLAATGPDTLDGALELWIDGASQIRLTGLDNSLSEVDYVRLGALSVKGGASGTLLFDEFASRRTTYIGPLP